MATSRRFSIVVWIHIVIDTEGLEIMRWLYGETSRTVEKEGVSSGVRDPGPGL